VAYGLKTLPSIESVRYGVNTGQSSFSNTLIQANPVAVQNGDASRVCSKVHAESEQMLVEEPRSLRRSPIFRVIDNQDYFGRLPRNSGLVLLFTSCLNVSFFNNQLRPSQITVSNLQYESLTRRNNPWARAL
jgi:hypothetical protein